MSKKMNLEYVNNSAMKAMKALPKEIALQFATDLQRVQEGKSPLSDFKHLKGIGQGGVIELIELIENGSPAYRAVYCAKYEDTVFVLHAFTKTTNGVDRTAMKTVEERYKAMMAEVNARKKQKKK
ncbi:type II toxin-antitoxin system RelE/ParE family toxin [Rhizobium leguminosarum bv. viciae]|nr:type II toxin-antitoxin system RelE/ParE family toxin [Rhizobium leguminosarum bv. viciae]